MELDVVSFLLSRVLSTLQCDNSIQMNNSNVIDRNHMSDCNRSYTFKYHHYA